MKSTTQKKAQRSIAASAAVLVGTGLAASAVPAQAAAPAGPASVLGVTQAPTQHLTRSQVKSTLIVHRGVGAAAQGSIRAAAPAMPTKKKAKKKKHRSRRS
ncbi:MAG TPA: hypothetical protein PLQ14_00870 [Actinomycetota bacterium]|nr:hypothetical protein [Candidatus Nanopelagicales bacterium]HPQ82990.1 hypothetical protein [Actinomycetota bacterium]